jgi:hypothetical protein
VPSKPLKAIKAMFPSPSSWRIVRGDVVQVSSTNRVQADILLLAMLLEVLAVQCVLWPLGMYMPTQHGARLNFGRCDKTSRKSQPAWQ